MPTNTNSSLDDGVQTTDLDAGRSFDAEAAKATLADTARRAERIVQDSLETLRSQSRVYVDAAGQQFGAAQSYVTERVKERPVAATVAGVGVGLLLGLLLASNRSSHRSRH